MTINMIKNMFLILTISLSTPLSAQVVKEITVSQVESFTDHLSLKEDSRDMDLMVKFVFDENANTLTVSLISYRTLFVFWDQIRYKPAFKRRTLRPKMLPYVAQCDPNDRFKVSKVFKWSIPRPRKKYVFNRWNTYEGLQPTPQEYQIVNDYICQTFDIVNKRNQVSLTLRDVFVMEHTAENVYEIFFGKDLYTQYQITIQRNPCFGKEEQLQSAQDAEKGIATAYDSFYKKYGSKKVSNEESMKMFLEMQDILTEQYPHQDIQSDCPDIQASWDNYNQYADSIRQMTCTVISQPTGTVDGSLIGILPKNILLKARQIDQMVARWMNSTDAMERRDLIMQCESLIKDCNEEISAQGASTPEQKQAVSVFQKAVRYYNNICK